MTAKMGGLKQQAKSNEGDGSGKPTRQSLMRAVALFLDGISRAVILPFGPSLVFRLVYGGTLKLGLDCAKVAYPLAVVVTAYLVGRALGASFAQKLSIPDEKMPRFVARLAGAVVSLHVFTFGAGLQSVWWLVLIRLISATLVGILCVITKEELKEEEETESQEERLESGLNDPTMSGDRRRHSYVDLASGTAKIYMTAFAVSILSGGLLYRHATGDATFQALTGSKQFTLSPLFLVVVSITAESILRCIFAFVGPRKKNDESVTLSKSLTSAKRSAPTHDSLTTHMTATEESDALYPSTPLKSRIRMESTSSDVFVQCRDRSDSTHSMAFTPCRQRLGTSEDEFFDCNSVISDMEDLPLFDEELGESSTNEAHYVDRKCVYANGTPAHVPTGDSPDIVPENYLAFCGGKRSKAEAMWKATQEWRRQHKVGRVHTVPHKWFPEIKKAYPHFIHGFSKAGYPIIYEQPGKMNLKQLFRDGCKVPDMIRHYIFFLEFLSNNISTKEEVRARMGPRPAHHNSSSWGTMVVMDVKGAGLSHLSGDVLSYLKNAGDINNNYYPLTMKRAFIVKSPFWLAGVWSSIKGIIPDSVTVDLLSSHQYLSAMREYIDDDQIPHEYGGSSPYKLGEHPFELELLKLVEEADKGEELMEELAMETKPETAHSLDQNTSTWKTEVDESSTLHGSTSSDSQVRSGLHPRRRRAAPTSSNVFVPTGDDNDDDVNDGKKGAIMKGEAEIFIIVSVMFALWSAIQGLVETAIPLWILIPPELGGLGYAPSRSGVAMFCSSMVLLWVMRTKVSKVISIIPTKAPMRSFRIGVGAESALLLLLATVPKSQGPSQRSDSVLVMTTTIIFMSCIVLSSMLGRASSTILHRIASATLARSNNVPKNGFTSRYGMDRLTSDCESGRLTLKINLIAEILGVLAAAPLCSWSLAHERPSPLDGTCCLFISSLVTFVLYVCSFSLHLNSVGEFAPHPRDRDGCSSDAHARRCGSFLCEIVTVSVGDMASLLDEANWSLTTPLLGHARRRSYSEAHEK